MSEPLNSINDRIKELFAENRKLKLVSFDLISNLNHASPPQIEWISLLFISYFNEGWRATKNKKIKLFIIIFNQRK